MKKFFSVRETGVFIFLMILLSLAVSIVMVILASLFFSYDASGGVTKNGLVLSLSGIITALLTWLVLLRHIKDNLSTPYKDYLGFYPIKLMPLIAWACVLITYIYVISWAANYWKLPMESSFLSDIYFSTAYGWVVIIFIVIFAPFLEEVLYRGYAYSGCIGSFGALPTVLITSSIWMATHLQYDIFQMVYIFFIGLIFGFARYHTNSLIAPLILHIMLNCFAVAEMLLIDG